jgi:hypothetical protein
MLAKMSQRRLSPQKIRRSEGNSKMELTPFSAQTPQTLTPFAATAGPPVAILHVARPSADSRNCTKTPCTASLPTTLLI